MKPNFAFRTVAWIGVFVVALDGPRSQAEDSRFVSKAFVGADFFVGFVPNTTNWISIESSSDLRGWTNIASVASTNSVTVFVDEDVPAAGPRVYRLRQPGFAVEDAEAKWAARAVQNYEFQLQHVRSHVQPHPQSATITVRGGQKTISNAEAEGQPLDQPDPNAFPKVEELLAALKQAKQSGCWRVAAIYDGTQGYPVWCVMERLTEKIVPGKEIGLYRIIGLSLTTAGPGG